MALLLARLRQIGNRVTGGNVGAHRIDHTQNAQEPLHALKFGDAPGIGFQPFETLAGGRVHDGAAPFFMSGQPAPNSPLRSTFYPCSANGAATRALTILIDRCADTR